MTLEDVHQQLLALRHHLDAILGSVERTMLERQPPQPVAPDVCIHPTEYRRDNSTMTQQRWRCMACGEEFEGVA